jgi:hypothetical protein
LVLKTEKPGVVSCPPSASGLVYGVCFPYDKPLPWADGLK